VEERHVPVLNRVLLALFKFLVLHLLNVFFECCFFFIFFLFNLAVQEIFKLPGKWADLSGDAGIKQEVNSSLVN
jgi:hypothetical protein